MCDYLLCPIFVVCFVMCVCVRQIWTSAVWSLGPVNTAAWTHREATSVTVWTGTHCSRTAAAGVSSHTLTKTTNSQASLSICVSVVTVGQLFDHSSCGVFSTVSVFPSWFQQKQAVSLNIESFKLLCWCYHTFHIHQFHSNTMIPFEWCSCPPDEFKSSTISQWLLQKTSVDAQPEYLNKTNKTWGTASSTTLTTSMEQLTQNFLSPQKAATHLVLINPGFLTYASH